jgi:biotin carboxyl carrier protein
MNYKITINGAEYEVHIHKVEGSKAYLTVNDVDVEAEVEGLIAAPARVTPKPAAEAMQSNTPVVKPKAEQSVYALKSPLPGVILEICVKEGDVVKAGQVMLVLEAMKMENSIQTEREGVVERINRSKGDSVLEGDVLLVIT